MNTSPHSPEFINEMKVKLLEEKTSLEGELAGVSKRRGGDYKSNFPDYGRGDEDNVTEFADYEASNATTEALEERLTGVIAALGRIDEGTYGVTEDGETISENRLRANPSATTVIKQ